MLKKTLVLIAALFLATAHAEAQGSLTVAWDPVDDESVAHYVIAYGRTAGAPTQEVQVAASTTEHTLTQLIEGERYYIVVHAKSDVGLLSSPSNEVNAVIPYAAAESTASEAARLVLGLDTFSSGGGWLNVKAGTALSVGTRGWRRLDWGAYNATGGETHPALGDIDGDGLAELVVGVGHGGGGWVAVYDDDQHGYAPLGWIRVQWDSYNTASGVTYPAVADVDGDGRAEIVVGLGKSGGGWFEVFDDFTAGFAHKGWGRVDWEAYNLGNGETHPAAGDLDGDGRAEIVIGFGTGGGGWLQVFDWSTTENKAKSRQWLRGTWGTYNAGSSGVTWPAVGDLDGNGHAEIVMGLGTGSSGWIEVLADDTKSHTSLKWLQTPWAAFNTANGETRPAVGDIDGDANSEVVIGLGRWAGNGGRILLFDDATAGFASLGFKLVGWQTYEATGGGLFPAVGKLR